MGVAIKCLLEKDVPDVPWMEGKSLAEAFFGDPELGPEAGGEPIARDKVIAVDFGRKPPATASPPTESLLAPINALLSFNGDFRWHEAARGIAAVRNILEKFDQGATVTMPEDFPFGADDEGELTEGVRYDLEELEKILVAARKARTRFCLVFDV